MTERANLKRQNRNSLAACILFCTLFLFLSASALAQQTETGKFRLHKFEQAIGEETYEIKREGDSVVVTSNFEFTDRGRRVPLTASLRAAKNLTPQSFTIKGNVSRFSRIDSQVDVNGASATVREEKQTKQVSAPREFFTISGYAPVTMQMMLVRYMSAHKIKNSIHVLPDGDLTIERRGTDRLTVTGKTEELTRYGVSGLIWGRETLWFDKQENLVAAVTVDAEFDHFEAIRDGYEPLLPTFVSKAAEDGMRALAELSAKLSPARAGALAITNARLVDVTNGAVTENASVVVENGRIAQVGASEKVKIPRGAKVIDAGGKTLLPGLWEMHAHFEQVEWGPVYLAAGVTTARDVGNEFEFITSARDAIEQGRGLGPRLLLAGIVDGDSPTALGVIRANTPEQAKSVVDRYHAAGFQQMKIYSSVKPDVVKAICDEAHRLGMTVTGHIPEGMTAIQGVELGIDQINHIQYIPPVMVARGARTIDFNSPEALNALKFFKDHGTVIDPTLVIFEWSLHPADVPFASIEPGAAKLPKELEGAINNTGVPAANAARAKAVFEQWVKTTGELHKAGIPIVAGTDQVVPGHSLHREIELYVQAGFTPLEAIQAATIVPARVMKLEKESGSIEVGKNADMMLVEGDPLADVSATRNVRLVIAGGKTYDPAQLWQSVRFKP